MSDFIEKIVGDLGQKKRWKAYRARVAGMPEPYRSAVAGIERYLMHAGVQGYDASVRIWEDLADLFDQAAADATPIRDIVGADPVEFADAFAANYGTKDWRARAQQRLRQTIDDLA